VRRTPEMEEESQLSKLLRSSLTNVPIEEKPKTQNSNTTVRTQKGGWNAAVRPNSSANLINNNNIIPPTSTTNSNSSSSGSTLSSSNSFKRTPTKSDSVQSLNVSQSGKPSHNRNIPHITGKKRLVILGGGYAGAKLARMAQNEKLNFDVTLIDTKTYFENTISVLRLVSTTDQKDQIKLTRELLIKHEDYLKDVHVYMQKVIAVTSTQVITEDETFYFDYLAVCTGSSYPLIKQSGNSEFRLKTLKDQIKIVQDSKIIVVVGGGYVGVELASELAIAYPNTKTVILVQRGDRLLARGGSSLSKKVLKFLTKAGVTVMLNSNVLNLQTTASEGFCLIQNTLTAVETRVAADKIFNAAGQVPNSKFMERYLGYSLDDRGYIIVNDYFQLGKNSNIFSLGDVCNIPEEKVAERASRHVDFLMKQLRKIVDCQADTTTGTEYSEFGSMLLSFISYMTIY
jgi:NADH dehydrogenase FAD-containing subunit